MKRTIIHIDEKQCTGCGACVPNCPEGALRIVDGKAKLVNAVLCDGLGACVGKCPFGAMRVEEQEVPKYDERKVIKNIVRKDAKVLKEHLAHLREHGQEEYLKEAIDYLKEKKIDVEDAAPSAASGTPCGCPGTRMMQFDAKPDPDVSAGPASSALRQWPIQLHLLNPAASYFKDADLVVAADCVPFSYADFHRRFLQGKALIVFCPKLDRSNDAYIGKMTEIIKTNTIRSITMVHMEVPCCSGVNAIVEEALKRSGKNIVLKEYTISLRGEIV